MQGLYEYLEGSSSTLETDIYTKASMVAMSHSVEKVVKEYGLYADIYVLFQDYNYFLYERKRYLEFDKICRQIFVFAKNIPEDAGKEFENTTFVELEDNSSLLKEWAVTVIHPDYSAVLATKEEIALQRINKEDYRVFEGFLSLDAEVAADAAVYYHNLLQSKNISYLDRDWEEEELKIKNPNCRN